MQKVKHNQRKDSDIQSERQLFTYEQCSASYKRYREPANWRGRARIDETYPLGRQAILREHDS